MLEIRRFNQPYHCKLIKLLYQGEKSLLDYKYFNAIVAIFCKLALKTINLLN